MANSLDKDTYFCYICKKELLGRFMADNAVYCGVVKSVGAGEMVVALSPMSADCRGCAVSALCTGKGTDGMEVHVKGIGYDVGDKVRVRASESRQWRAIVVCLLLPLALVAVVAVLMWMFSRSDEIVALGVLVAVVFYFAVMKVTGVDSGAAAGWIVENYE